MFVTILATNAVTDTTIDITVTVALLFENTQDSSIVPTAAATITIIQTDNCL